MPQPTKPYRQQILDALSPTAFFVTAIFATAIFISSARCEQATLRRPVALAIDSVGQYVYVANRETGTVSIIDTRQRRVVNETKIATRPSDVTWLVDDKLLLLTDEREHQVIVAKVDGPTLEVVQRLPVAAYPVKIELDRASGRCFISSLWSRRLSALLFKDGLLQNEWTLDLEIAPREMLFVAAEERLIVADSFTGELLIVDPQGPRALGTTEVPGHNIRGLAIGDGGGSLIVVHQMLNELAHSVRNDVHWGLVISNDLRWLQLETVLQRKANIYEGSRMQPLGEPGNASGDPSAVGISKSQAVIVTLGGVDEVAVARNGDLSMQRYKVGDRPTAITIDHGRDIAYVANTLGDSVSIVDLKTPKVEHTISLGRRRPLTAAEAGERLFFDAYLSHDNWMSCSSCHPDGHTNGMLADNFSDESFGAPKRILSLLGKAGTEPLAWNAKTEDFQAQVRKSIIMTMQCDREPTDQEVANLAAYVENLPAPPSVDQARNTLQIDSIQRGREFFASRKCNRCHKQPHYTSDKTYNVGLQDEHGNSRFNPPSLKGISQRRMYFHDNRAKSLSEVFVKYKHQMQKPPEPEQLDDLLQFLRSL